MRISDWSSDVCSSDLTALDEARVKAADIVPRRAEQHRGLGIVKTEQVDDRALDVGGRDGDGLIGDVAMAAVFADGRDAQRILLVTLGELDDRLRERRREKQSEARLGGAIEGFLEVDEKVRVEP